MKTLFAIITGLWLVVILAEPALANCQMMTIMKDGRMQTCTVCYIGQLVQVTCH